MNKLRAFTLGVWMICLAALLVAGRYSLFIRAELWPLLLGTTLMFALLLAALITRVGHGPRAVSAGAVLQGAMLLLPLIYMAVNITGVAAAGLSSDALRKRSLGSGDAAVETAADLQAGTRPTDAGQLTSLAYVMRHPKGLTGRHLTTEGRVSKDDTMAAGEAVVFRFVVVCCAADATPAHVIVRSADLSKFKNDDWVRVEGDVTTVDQDGARVPVLQNATLRAIPTPAEPYLTPY